MCIPALFDDKADRNACIVARVNLIKSLILRGLMVLDSETDRNACIASRVQLIEILKPRALAVSLAIRSRLSTPVVR